MSYTKNLLMKTKYSKPLTDHFFSLVTFKVIGHLRKFRYIYYLQNQIIKIGRYSSTKSNCYAIFCY